MHRAVLADRSNVMEGKERGKGENDESFQCSKSLNKMYKCT